MAFSTAQRSLLWHRVQEGLREIGVLLMTFAPLDVAFTDSPNRHAVGALFLLIGMLLFSVSLFAELRRVRNA